MKNPLHEYRVFLSYPHNMRVLLITNLIYAFVMPVIEIFIGAYVMRNSNDVKMVIAYQLAVYTGIPFTFLVNGWLLQKINIKRLYSFGMLLSGVSMVCMMSLKELSLGGLIAAGLLMGMSFGLYWSNRDFLALSSTNDGNRNYYYGLETFFATNIGIVIPVSIGAFIGSFGARANVAYQIITGLVFVLTLIASWVLHRGEFDNPPRTPFIHFRSGDACHDPARQGRLARHAPDRRRRAVGHPALHSGTHHAAAPPHLHLRGGPRALRGRRDAERAAL
ncbi:MAG: MFS transporter [Kiritimatiellaeota bacterium]|nr:MFS transporter [Kiritimatiellota bacterium]